MQTRKNKWPPELDKILIDNYSRLNVKEIQLKYLPEKTIKSIYNRAKRLKLRAKNRDSWSIEMDKILIKFYNKIGPTGIKEKYIPERTVSNIQFNAARLKLTKKGYVKDLTGQSIKNIKILKFLYTKNKHAHWLCECKCKKTFIVSSGDMSRSGNRSCEKCCLRSKIIRMKNIGKKYGSKNGPINAARATEANIMPKNFESSLAGKFPELIKEWDYKHNKKIKPENIKCGSAYKAGWVCSICKHTYIAKIFSRTTHSSACPKCKSSKGEKTVSKILDKLNIKYEIQKRFPDCKHENTLAFDFFILSKNICIEYNGIQHYKIIDFGSGNYDKNQKEFESTKRRDKIKKDWCKKNNIILIVISYLQFKNIEKIITKLFTKI